MKAVELFGCWFASFSVDRHSSDSVNLGESVIEWLGERGIEVRSLHPAGHRYARYEATLSEDEAVEFRVRWGCRIERRGGW